MLYILLKKVTKILEERLKFKPLTKQQIFISLDRLTRFKHSEEKYLRVFKDIIISNLIDPKYCKKQLDLMPYDKLRDLFEYIFNSSLNQNEQKSLVVNKKILKYEKETFSLNQNALILLENKINYNLAIKLIENEKLPLNLLWLKSLSQKSNQKRNREQNLIKFPIEKVVITEGVTEEILLPEFAKLCGYDFDKFGVHLISAGGKNQVVKLFYQLSESLKLPVFVLLDSDAKENFAQISIKLRKSDKVYIIPDGEFEDILPVKLVKKALNNHFKNFSSVTLKDLNRGLSMVKTLEELFKQKGFGDFKKAEFASIIKRNISSKMKLSESIFEIVKSIKAL